MYELTLVNASLIILILLFAWLMYRFNRLNPHYNVVDMLLGSDGRASVTNHILLAMASLSIWVVIDRELDGKDVETILLGVLSVFVLKQGATQITEILTKPSAPSESSTTTIEATTTKTAVGKPPLAVKSPLVKKVRR